MLWRWCSSSRRQINNLCKIVIGPTFSTDVRELDSYYPEKPLFVSSRFTPWSALVCSDACRFKRSRGIVGPDFFLAGLTFHPKQFISRFFHVWAEKHSRFVLNLFRHPFWSWSSGADHFYVCAHDVGAKVGSDVLKNSIALVNSADYDDPYFVPHKVGSSVLSSVVHLKMAFYWWSNRLHPDVNFTVCSTLWWMQTAHGWLAKKLCLGEFLFPPALEKNQGSSYCVLLPEIAMDPQCRSRLR